MREADEKDTSVKAELADELRISCAEFHWPVRVRLLGSQ
jgi:hypothetical protein